MNKPSYYWVINSVPVQAIHAKPSSGHHHHRPPLKLLPTAHSSMPSSTAPTSLPHDFYRCGSKEHLVNDCSCPAALAQCNYCQKIGHYLQVCCSGQTRSLRENDLPVVQIFYMHDSITDKIRCSVVTATTTTSVPIKLNVDSGLSV